MWTFLQDGTTDSSLVISASDPTQKQRQGMPWLSAGRLCNLMLSLCLLLIGRMPSEVGAGTSEKISIDSTSVAKPEMVSNSFDN